MISDENSVTFLERSRGGPYKVTPHRFEFTDWQKHVTDMMSAGKQLWEALGYTEAELEAFASAALSSVNS